jgi:hypothetical protein
MTPFQYFVTALRGHDSGHSSNSKNHAPPQHGMLVLTQSQQGVTWPRHARTVEQVGGC